MELIKKPLPLNLITLRMESDELFFLEKGEQVNLKIRKRLIVKQHSRTQLL